MATNEKVAAPDLSQMKASDLSIEQLVTMVTAAVVKAVGTQTNGMTAVDIGQAVAEGIAKNQRRKVTFGEYNLSGHSSFHQKSKAETPVLKCSVFQNNVWLNPVTLFDAEIELLNTITHSGRYIERLVEVGVTDEGASRIVHIRFNNATPDQLLELKGHARNFLDMLRQIKAAQDEERAEQEELKSRKAARREYGSKAYREAAAAAAE